MNTTQTPAYKNRSPGGAAKSPSALQIWVPAAVSVMGALFTLGAALYTTTANATAKTRELNIEMVKIAADILQAGKDDIPPTKEQIEWAVSVVNTYADPDIPEEVKNQIFDNPLPSSNLDTSVPAAPITAVITEAPSVENRTGGWVSIGFLPSGSTTLEDPNFVQLLDGNQTTLSATPKPGDILKALVDINVRSGAAEWGGKRWAMRKGACLQMIATTEKPMPGGATKQVWAQGATLQCDSK